MSHISETDQLAVSGHGKAAHSEGQPDDVEVAERFSPDEEASLLGESEEKKAEANALFVSAKYETAIEKYDEAINLCPHYLDYELAVLNSNMAACHLKLQQWKESNLSATKALGSLERLEKNEDQREEHEVDSSRDEGGEEVEEEIVSSGAKMSAPLVETEREASEQAKVKRKVDRQKIRAKALMRRARARSELGGWSDLSGAMEDYKALSTMPNLGHLDKKVVSAQLRALPARVKAAQEKEMSEMWGKLKGLGDGLLKPFGMSTDNFKMVKDEKSGGYSMSFNQTPKH